MENVRLSSSLELGQAPPQTVLPWDDRLTLGLPEIDAEHRQLVELINRLSSRRAEGAGEEELRTSLGELRRYILDHFQHETGMMQRYAISDAHRQLHSKAHQGFIDCLNGVGALIKIDPAGVVDNLLALLAKWLVFHIDSVDRRLAEGVIALRAGVAPDQAMVEKHAFENTLVDSMGDLYGLLGKRTFELVESNRRFQETRNEAVQSHEYLDKMLAALDNVVWSIKPDTYETIYLNPAAERVYGHPVADFIADSSLWFKTVHPDDRKRVGDCMPEIMKKGVMDIEYRIVRPDGDVRWIHDHIHAIFDEHGKAVSLNGLGTDVTLNKTADITLKKNHNELQEAYSKLQQAKNQLLQSEKMASIGQLAAGVAHEINNPIGYVYSNLGSLQKYLEDMLSIVAAYETIDPLLAQHPEALAGITAVKQKADLAFLKEDVTALMSESREGITRVKKIVQNLKDFSHAGSDEVWQQADLRQGLDSTLNIVWNELKYKCEVNKDYAEIPDIECLPSQLNQVFMNLLVNAAHSIEEKGIITLRTGTQDDQVWVEVADTGKGIAAEHINRIFEPFFTTKPVGKGTGLGLSVSYSIIQTHHGSIDVTSEVGKGTTFRISLPLKQPETEHAKAAPAVGLS